MRFWLAETTIAAIPAATVATEKAALAPATSTIFPATDAPTATPSPSAVPIQVNASVTADRGTSSSASVNELISDGETAIPASTTNGPSTPTPVPAGGGTPSTVMGRSGAASRGRGGSRQGPVPQPMPLA